MANGGTAWLKELDMPRLRMIAPARDVVERAGSVRRSSVVIEPLASSAAQEASDVLVEAYRTADDTLDDDGEQLRLFWAGEWGPAVPTATVCARSAPAGEMVGLSLVCLFEGLAFVAHLVVAEPHRRHGVAATLLASSAQGLLEEGIDTLELAVDASNRAALHLYTRLGFGSTLRGVCITPLTNAPGSATRICLRSRDSGRHSSMRCPGWRRCQALWSAFATPHRTPFGSRPTPARGILCPDGSLPLSQVGGAVSRPWRCPSANSIRPLHS